MYNVYIQVYYTYSFFLQRSSLSMMSQGDKVSTIIQLGNNIVHVLTSLEEEVDYSK